MTTFSIRWHYVVTSRQLWGTLHSGRAQRVQEGKKDKLERQSFYTSIAENQYQHLHRFYLYLGLIRLLLTHPRQPPSSCIQPRAARDQQFAATSSCCYFWSANCSLGEADISTTEVWSKSKFLDCTIFRGWFVVQFMRIVFLATNKDVISMQILPFLRWLYKKKRWQKMLWLACVERSLHHEFQDFSVGAQCQAACN